MWKIFLYSVTLSSLCYSTPSLGICCRLLPEVDFGEFDLSLFVDQIAEMSLLQKDVPSEYKKGANTSSISF